ncbi:hypothetical protein CYMTET_56213 [Cymbomonas tetramitiformis]|uniref:Uncharacterized protein n=1 Tax=Cymbomonas tetramitiformis TaxID=36881 RepID=A0AAE0BCJ5_9CHLO|nr:hypothetical protein CYMTET_56213 [Cymbomonas tetramitiformis]
MHANLKQVGSPRAAYTGCDCRLPPASHFLGKSFSKASTKVARVQNPRLQCTISLNYQKRRGLGVIAESTSQDTQSAVSSRPPVDLKETLKEIDQNLNAAMLSLSGGEDTVDGNEIDKKESAEKRAVDALNLLKSEGHFPAFGGARQIPKAEYSLADLRLNKIEPLQLLSPTDSTLTGVRQTLTTVSAIATVGAAFAFNLGAGDFFRALFGLVTFKTVDQVLNAGGAEALLLDSCGRAISPEYRERVANHEAGHFLCAYLLGILPKGYTLSSWEALQKYGALNVQAGCLFCDEAMQMEVATGKIASRSVDRFSCVALAGVAVEYLKFEQAEGGLSDVQQLDSFMQGLGFTQKKADGQVRWAVLNTISLLREFDAAHTQLVAAMSKGASVGECLVTIEESIAGMEYDFVSNYTADEESEVKA